MFTVALAGNPNCGKTTLMLHRSQSACWKLAWSYWKEGRLRFGGNQYNIVDLPGTYSLGAYSEDEIVARNFILKDKPDLVVNVVDATNIERNLYLTVQLLEMGANVVIALNMIDEAEKRGIKIDVDSLQRQLGVPIVPMIASRQKGIDDLKSKISEAVKKNAAEPVKITYGREIDEVVASLAQIIKQSASIRLPC